MKRVKCLIAAVLALCMLAGCGVAAVRGERDGLRLYYAAPLETHRGGDAIDSVTVGWEHISQDGDTAAQAAEAMALLLGGYQENGFFSPLPAGTTLRSVTMKGSTAWVDLSGSYSQLSGMALTIVDYCVALTLTQLEGIYAVHITVNGQELAYRDNNVFLAGNVLLTSMDDVVRTLTARLCFPSADGEIVEEERLLTQYEGQSAADVVLSALIEGPSSDDLQPLFPEGFNGMTARVEDGTCQLNLLSVGVEDWSEEALSRTMECVSASLRSLDGVGAVQLYVDGEYRETYE